MRAAGVVLVLLAVSLGAVVAKDMSHELDEIENIDSSVFNTDAGLVSASPIEQAAAAVVSARDADLDADTEAVAALAAESGASAASDEGAMYSFRAMRHATELAGSSISVGEKASETHAAAMRILKGGKRVSADELFLEINREQQILAAKRALVARQKQSIADSEESLQRLKRLIGDNKSILAKNEHALRRASDDLLQLISKYQAKLRAGITREVGGTADTPAGQPMRSRPHQRAAFTKWAPRGQRKVDTTKSKVALAAANAKGAKTVDLVPAATATAAAATPKKMKFAEANAEADAEDAAAEAVADEAAAEVAAEEHAEAEAEAQSEESDESEEEEEESDSESDESESEESDDESENESESESDEFDESDESDESESLLESGAAVDLTVSRDAVLAGLPAMPHLYDETADAFVF